MDSFFSPHSTTTSAKKTAMPSRLQQPLARLEKHFRVLVLVRAKNQSKRGVVSRGCALSIEVVHVELELSQILMAEFPDLEVDEYVAFQDSVIKTRST